MAEAEIIARIAEKFGCTEYYKNPVKTGIDYSLVQGGLITGLVEVKDRPEWTRDSLDRAGGLMISAYKLHHGIDFASLTGIKLSIGVRLAQGSEIWLARLFRPEFKTFRLCWYNGNNVPREDGDKEPVFYLPMSKFKLL